MKKTNLGIPVGVLAALLYVVGFYSGVLATLLLSGYILLKENDEWLKEQAVKVILLIATFAALGVVVDIIPDTISVFSSFLGIFGGSLYIAFLNNIFSFIGVLLSYIRMLVFMLLAYKALSMKTVKVPFIDSIITKVASGEATELKDLKADFTEDFADVKTTLGKAKDDVVSSVNEQSEKLKEKLNKDQASPENK